MLQRFQRELSGENKIIGVCTFIDPRTGLDLRASGYPTADAVGAVNQHVQHAVHEAFIVLDGPIPPADPVPAGQAPGGAAVGGSSDFWERAAAVELSPYQRRQLKVVDEVKAYLAILGSMSPEARQGLDPLQFWFRFVPSRDGCRASYLGVRKPSLRICEFHVISRSCDVCRHQAKLPHLALVARRYLCVLITSVAIESMFSQTGHILSPKRTALGYLHFRDLALLKTNSKYIPINLHTTWPALTEVRIFSSRQASGGEVDVDSPGPAGPGRAGGI
jgi:hypothetical protein